jgi:hypothetical protein
MNKLYIKFNLYYYCLNKINYLKDNQKYKIYKNILFISETKIKYKINI